MKFKEKILSDMSEKHDGLLNSMDETPKDLYDIEKIILKT